MFNQLSDIDGRILALHLTSEITDQEHRLIDMLLRHYIRQCGRINVLVVVTPYPSLSCAEALYEDLRMVKLHAAHIDRLAVVGPRPLNSTYVGLFGLFGGMQADYFDAGQIEAALRWLRAGTPQRVQAQPQPL